MKNTRLTIEEVKERCLIYGIEYIDGEYKNFDSKINVKCNCGTCFETTLRTMKNTQKYKKKASCPECSSKYISEFHRTPFNEIEKVFELNGCILISEEKDFINYYSKLKYISKCEHVSETSYMSFKLQKHYLCSDCAKQINAKEKAYNWKGGTYDSESIAFRKTYAFKKWHKDVFMRDHYTCQCCGQIGGKLNSHHLDGYNWCIDKRTEIDNGTTLCKECHERFHLQYGRGDNTKEQFDEYLKQEGKRVFIHDIVFN